MMLPELKALIVAMPIWLRLFAGILELIGVSLLVKLWRGRDHPIVKLLWSPVLIVPFFGALAFVAVHDPPSPSDPTDRPPERLDDVQPPLM